jgi:hypothetical protein
MPKATVRATSQATPADSNLPDPQPGLAFGRAYTRWLKARAAMEDPDDPDPDDGHESGMRRKVDLEYERAEKELILAPAIMGWMVWDKIEVFELALRKEMHDGPRRDRFLILALGAIKADLLRLRIGSDPSALENGALQ